MILRVWIVYNKKQQTFVASDLGISKSRLNRILHDGVIPEPEFMERIRIYTQDAVRCQDFYNPNLNCPFALIVKMRELNKSKWVKYADLFKASFEWIVNLIMPQHVNIVQGTKEKVTDPL